MTYKMRLLDAKIEVVAGRGLRHSHVILSVDDGFNVAQSVLTPKRARDLAVALVRYADSLDRKISDVPTEKSRD